MKLMLLKGCDVRVSLSNIRDFVTGDAAAPLRLKLLDRSLSKFVADNKDKVFHCPHPKCAGMFRREQPVKEEEKDKKKKSAVARTSRKQCSDCGKPVCTE